MPRDQAPAASTTISAGGDGAVFEQDALRAAALHDNLLTGRCSWMRRRRLRRQRAAPARACGCRPGGPAAKTMRRRFFPQDAARARASPRPKAIRAADRAGAETPAGARSRPDRRRSRRAPACPRAAIRHRCRLRAQAPRRKPASAPGCRGRARPAPPRRARLRNTPPACRRRHGSRPLRPCRGRTPSPRRGAASRQAMPRPTTPAPMMATRGRCRGRDGVNSVAQRGSLRWYDPDRFDGCDLSRVSSRGTPGRCSI